MRYYEEPAKKLPVAAECDVLVAGSGPAGFSAAINAARQGAKTILVENADAVGGIATVGMMSHFTGSVKSKFYAELLGRMTERVRGEHNEVPAITIDTEQMKILCQDMLEEAGVDYDRAVFPGSFETTVDTPKGELQALAKKLLPFPAGHVLLYKNMLPGVVTVNMTNSIQIDGTDALSLTRGEMVCRSQLNAIVDFLREYVPGYEHCFLISSASLLGVRETRHFKGLYTLTEEDIFSCAHFEDWVVREARFNFDVHNLTGASLDATGVQKKFPRDNAYEIPYRCLLPDGVDGLLLAGRNISGTHMAHSNYRVMPMCVAMGEAAGVAAALASARGVDPKQVPAKDIQDIIR